ncbi:MAG: branched-chain amino acid ABC transporter permease [Rhodospirillales bacterium]
MTVASFDTMTMELRQRRVRFYALGGIGVVLALIAPQILYSVFLMMALCFALFASSFNLLFGYLGLLSFGHAAFFGGAAYATGWAIRNWGFTPELGILFGGMVAGVMGLAVGVLAVRRTGIYFAMITFALAEFVYFLANQLSFTGGENGLTDVPRRAALGFIDITSSGRLYYFILVVVALSIWALWRIVHSPFGGVLKAIHQNEPRAISLGYDVQKYKIVAFVLSAFFSGIAGGAKVLVFQFAALADVHWSNSGEPVMMTLMGGMGTTMGPTIGAFFVTALQFYLAELGEWVTIIYGAIFMIFVLALRRGVLGEAPDIARKIARWVARRRASHS